MRIEARGANARLAHGVAALIAGQPESNNVDAHTIQAFYAGLVGRDCGMDITVTADPEFVLLIAVPAAKAVAGEIAPTGA